MDSDHLAEVLLAAIPAEELHRGRPEGWGEAFILPRPVPEAERALKDLVRERVVPVALDLREAHVAASDVEPPDVFVQPALLERLDTAPGSRLRIASVSGTRFSSDLILSQAYLKDLEMVSGGTGYVTLQLADPVVGEVREGFRIRGLIEVLKEDQVEISITGEIAGAPRLGRKGRVRIDQAPGSRSGLPPAEGAGTKPAPGKEEPSVWQEIDLPDAPRWTFEVDLQVPTGKPVLLRAVPDPEKPGVTRALIGLVNVIRMEEK